LLNKFIAFQILVSKYLHVTKAQVEKLGILIALVNGFSSKATGQTPSYGIRDLYSYPLFFNEEGRVVQYIAFVAIFILLILGTIALLPHLRKKVEGIKNSPRHSRLPLYLTTALVGLSAMNEMRYMTALVPLIPIIVCRGLILIHQYNNRLSQGVFAFLILYLTIGHYKALESYHIDNITWSYHPFKAVYETLDSHDLKYGYGSYPFQASIAFLSEEEIKISPQIGPTYMDKLPHYSQAVDAELDVFYIVPVDSGFVARKGPT
jgi:hypothetical protein